MGVVGATDRFHGIYAQVILQNRGKLVNSQSQTQFNNLDVWLTAHMKELCAVLEPGQSF